jgi:palmitoyltransferase
MFLTPLTITLLSVPVYLPILSRATSAWAAAAIAPDALRWWSWDPSWIVPCGPVGRYAVGLALGWRYLDAEDGGGVVSLEMGLLLFIGTLLSAMTMVSPSSN